MKKILSFITLLLLLVGCSGTMDTTNMSSDERLAYGIKLYNDEDYEEAVKEFESIVIQYPGSSIIDDAQYYLAMTRFQREEYILAAYQFSRLIKSMPSSEFLSDSQYMLAECYYQLSPNFNLDQQYTKKAVEEFQAFIDYFPLSEKVPEAEAKIKELNQKLARKEFDTARIYSKLEYYNASIKYYDNVMEVYHDTEYAPLALYSKIRLLRERGRDSEAIVEAKKFLEKYPDHENAVDVQKIINSLESELTAKSDE